MSYHQNRLFNAAGKIRLAASGIFKKAAPDASTLEIAQHNQGVELGCTEPSLDVVLTEEQSCEPQTDVACDRHDIKAFAMRHSIFKG